MDASDVGVVIASSTSSDEEKEEGGYGLCFPHDMGLLQSMLANSSGSLRKSSSFAMYAGFVAGGPNDDADDDDIAGSGNGVPVSHFSFTVGV